jgi:ketosteroid isomerase-like protein
MLRLRAHPHLKHCFMRTVLLILIGSLLPLQAASAQQVDSVATNTVPSVALPPALDRVLRDYEQAWRDYDAEALAALFTEDGFVLRSGHLPVRGRDAIAAAYQDAGGRLHLRALAFEQSGPTAYIIGGYTSTPKWPDAGKFILTLRKEPDDRWRITADMDNRNR